MAKTELEEAGLETEGMVESTAKLRSEILALSGVDIMDNANEFKSTYKIMDELAAKWENLTDIQQATVTELIAGKRQGNIVSSLMTNFDTARDALETSLKSSGSAMREHEKWQESLEAHINSLKAAWQSLAQSFMDSDALKAGINIITEFVEALQWAVDNLGVLGTIGTGIVTKNLVGTLIGSIKGKKGSANGINTVETDINTTAINNNTNSTNANTTAVNANTTAKQTNATAKQASTAAENADAAATANDTNLTNLNTAAEKNNTASTVVDTAVEEAHTIATNLDIVATEADTTATNANTVAENNNANAANNNADAVNNLTKSTGKSVSAFSKFSSAIGGWLGIASIVVTVISAIVNAQKKLREEASAARQEAIEEANAFLEASNTFEQAYLKYSDKTDLTTTEENELKAAIDSTVDALGDKANALKNVVDSSGDYIASLEAIRIAELNATVDAAKSKQKNAKGEIQSTIENDAGLISVRDAEARDIAAKVFGDAFVSTSRNNGYTNGYYIIPPDVEDFDAILDYYDQLIKYRDKLADNNLGDTKVFTYVNEEIDALSANIETYREAEMQLKKANYQLDYGTPKTVDDYLKMRKEIIEGIGGDVNSRLETADWLDDLYGKAFDLTSAETQARMFSGIIRGNRSVVQTVEDATKGRDFEVYGADEIETTETFLNMRTAVNNNECTVGEYMAQFDKIDAMMVDWRRDDKEIYSTSLALDSDSVKKQYDDLYKYISRNYLEHPPDGMNLFNANLFKENETERIKDLLDSLTLTELQAVANIKTEIDWATSSVAAIKKQIEEEAKLIEAISFSVDLDIETEKLDNLATAVTESLSGAGLGNESMSLVEDMFGDLDSYDPTALFERTANGIRLNAEEYRKLNDEYKKENIDGLGDKLGALGTKYNKTREELSDLTYGSEEYNDKLRELNNIEDQINATETLISQYKGLTSAYQSWQRAESSGSQRDMYENMIKGFETIDDEISRGWLDDGTIEFLRLIKGENISATATTKELTEAYKSLDDTIANTTYSVRDFFTVDEDGNSTNTGVYNFLDAIGQLEEEKFGGKNVVERDENDNIISFDFKVAGGDKAIADALGISEELVQIMVRAADDAGFVVSMDGTYQQLDTLKTKAQEAADKLKDTFGKTKFEFNLNTGNEKSVKDQYNEALKIWEEYKKNKNEDGTINMNVEGAEDAFTLVSTLQSMVDKLSEPTYMKLDSTQVEKDMQTPLSKLQEYERLAQQEHQLNLKGTDTSDLDEAQNKIIDYFEGLDPEIQASLGIKNNSREEIQQKLESGEIEIPATIDLQVEMNDTLRDMVNVSLYNAGIIDEKELKKRVDVEVYAENVDTEDVDESVKEEIENKKSKKRKANIKIVAKTIGVEDVDDLSEKLKDLDDKSIKAIAEVLGQVDVDKLKNTIAKLEPKQVEAIATAIGEGDVDSLKTAISNLNPTYVQAIAEAFGYSDVQDLYNAIENLDPKTVEAVANALGITDVENLKGAIDNVKGKDVEVNATTSGESKLSGLKSLIDGIKSKTVTVTSWFKKITSGGSTRNDSNGFSEVNGTANVNGTTGRAFKQGSWGTKNSGTALVGELGRETLIRNGKYYTVGDYGAEFIKYQRGDIILNHKQTEELLKNGKVTSDGGRAKALVGGTAFVEGTAFGSGSSGFGGIGKVITDAAKSVVKKVGDVVDKVIKKKTDNQSENDAPSTKGGNPSTSSGSDGINDAGDVSKLDREKTDSSDDKTDKFEETVDWVEIALSRMEREIDNLDKKVGNVYKSWSERNTALGKEINKVGDAIALQQSAAQEYLKEANQVGLSESYAKKIRDGSLSIEDFEGESDEKLSDEKLVEKIKDYQSWYEKYLDCIDAAEELREQESKLYAQRFENVQSQYNAILQGYEHTESMLNEYISQAEAQGHIVSEKYYNALIENEKQNINALKQEQASLIAERDKAVADGKITKYSEEWYLIMPTYLAINM